mgnify:FL=1
MNNKTAIITGITSGIGTEIAIGLAKHGYKLHLLSRTQKSGNRIKENIIKSTNNESIDVYECDLSLQKNIHKFVNDFKQKNDGLDVLINNAGIIPKKRIITIEGIEMQFAVNYIAPFLLSHLLLDYLKKNSPSRIINTGTIAHASGNLNSNDFQGNEKKYRGFSGIYGDTKLALTIFTIEMAKKLEGTGVTCNVIHPGVVNTNLGRNVFPKIFYVILRPIGKVFLLSSKKGAEPIIKAAISNEFDNINGNYYKRFKNLKPSKKVFNENLNERLWNYTIELTQLTR